MENNSKIYHNDEDEYDNDEEGL